MLAVPPVSGGNKCDYHTIPGAFLRLFKMFSFYIGVQWVYGVGFVSGL